MPTRHLTAAEVIAIHHRILERMGMPHLALRDEAALQSAVARPRMAEFYDGADLIRKATILVIGLSQAQAFVDGNKRVALVAADLFLVVNGLTLIGEPLELAKLISRIAAPDDQRAVSALRLEPWLRDNVRPMLD